MAKKKPIITEEDEYKEDLDEVVLPPEDTDPEDEENEDGDNEDLLQEDEDDKQVIAKLEKEDREAAESGFAFEEEPGFDPLYDWDGMPESELDEAKSWREMSVDEVNNLKFSRMPQFKKWVIAGVCKKLGLHDKFCELASSLIKTKKNTRDPRLLFEDIYLELISDFVAVSKFDDAFATIDLFEKSEFSDNVTVQKVRALTMIASGKTEEGKQLIEALTNRPFNKDIPGFENEHCDEGNLRCRIFFEFAQSLIAMKFFDLATEYLDRSMKLALLINDTDLILEIHDARAYVRQQQKVE